ncbi:redoxin domain-containing protein [Myroides pelagicus]|uniref:redoxin domain-containing protein n=1 Tax=Myroides pelagicus TaxID=270914 RepID=UPI002DBE164C|nr:redoxin domain-containing protein [Myroides pelagicus]MEC4113889.1 redoxin domain-containing protein [Myroides pelagicus]
MSHYRLLILLLGLPFLFSFGSKQKKYTIHGNTQQQEDGTLIYLYLLDPIDNTFVKKDSTTIHNNTYTFKGSILNNSYALLSNKTIEDYFILENGVINAKNTSIDNNTSSITGTINNDALNTFTKQVTEVQEELKKFKTDNQPLLEQAIEAKNGQLIDSISTAFNNKLKQLTETILKQTLNTPNSFVSMIVIYQRLTNNNISREEAYANYHSLSPELKNTNIGQAIGMLIDKLSNTKLSIGDKAPNFEIKDLSGNTFKLYDNLNKSKVTILHFWAPWCPSCEERLPTIKATRKQYSLKDVQIISIALDDDNEELRKTIVTEDLNWTHIASINSLQQLYDVKTIPTIFILDQTGIIQDIKHLEPDTTSVIQDILQN